MVLSKLKNYGEEPIFSTRFVRDFISWIDIGTPDLGQNKEAPVNITNIPDFFWSMKMEGVRFGERNENAWTFERMEEGAERNGGIYTIFDTGASDIYLSVLWFEAFVEQLYAATGITYEINGGTASSACEANFPDLYFLLDKYWMQVRPVDYLREDGSSSNICELKIKPIEAGFNILGMPAHIGYYISHYWE